MSRQRERQLRRQPIEEAVRLAISELVGPAGVVEVERHSYDWRPDDLLVWIRLGQPITDSALSLFRHRVAKEMHGLLPSGHELDEWLVVVECKGETLSQLAWHDTWEIADEAGGT